MRTLLDLADVLTAHRLERVCHRAEVLRLLDVRVLEHVPAGRRTRTLRTALASLADAEPQVTRSELEERFLALVAARGLPRPRTNALVHGHEVDFLWPHARLVAETDGAAAHLTPRAFEGDRDRDQVLALAGFTILRFTARQVTRTPDLVVARLRAALLG